jgi:hypothetical protein
MEHIALGITSICLIIIAIHDIKLDRQNKAMQRKQCHLCPYSTGVAIQLAKILDEVSVIEIVEK